MALREILIAFGVTVDTDAIDKGDAKAKGFLKTLGEFAAAVGGAFAVNQLWEFTNAQVALGDELGDAAVLMDLSTESLERWRYAAQFAEITGAELSAMFLKISKAATSAGTDIHGVGGIIKNDLKIDVSDYKSSEEVFEAIGIKLAGMEAGFKRNALASQLFGKAGGIKILQLFKDGKEGIERYNEEFENLGGGMLEFAEKAGEADEAQKRLNFAFGNLKVRIAGVLLPAMLWLVQRATHLSAALGRLVRETHLIQTALVLFATVAATKAALIIAAWLPVIAPFLAWAAAIGLAVLALEDVYGFFTGKNSLIGKAIDSVFGEGSQQKVRDWFTGVYNLFKEAFAKWAEIFKTTEGSIVDTMQALIGYIEGTFAAKLREIFGDVTGDMIAHFLSAITEVVGLFVGMATTIKNILSGLAAPIRNLVKGAPVEDAKNNADIAAGKRAATAGDFDTSQRPWYMRALGAAVGFSPEQAVPVRVPGAGPSQFGPPPAPVAPVIHQAIAVAPGTPQAQQRALAAAAASGTTAALSAPNRAAALSLGRRG
jgi:hypothetical protein